MPNALTTMSISDMTQIAVDIDVLLIDILFLLSNLFFVPIPVLFGTFIYLNLLFS